MIAALAATAAVALVAVLALVLTTRGSAGRLAGERARATDLEQQLHSAEQAARDAFDRADAGERRAGEAEARAKDAAARADEADRRAADAENRAAAAAARADEADRRAADAENRAAGGMEEQPAGGRVEGIELGSAGAEALWELERMRLAREWQEVAGPDAALPSPWDGTVAGVLAVELAIIREVVGTPSRLEVADGSGAADPATAVAAARLAGELLRSLARASDELEVSLSAGTGVTISVDSATDDRRPAVDELARVAAAAGGELQLTPTEGGLRARLWLPPATAPGQDGRPPVG